MDSKFLKEEERGQDREENAPIASTSAESSQEGDGSQEPSSPAGAAALDPDHRWSCEMPVELLEAIFEWLMVNNRHRQARVGWLDVKASYLSVRATHPRWKGELDSLLEKKCLGLWTKPNLTHFCADPSQLFNMSQLPVLENKEDKMLKFVVCLPPVYAATNDANPFPSKSLKVKPTSAFDEGPEFENETCGIELQHYTVMRVLNFFSAYAHHLTSLIFCDVSLDTFTLAGILENTINLRALKLENCRIRVDPAAELPTLNVSKSLEHLHFFEFGVSGEGESYESVSDEVRTVRNCHLLNWFLEPLKAQLKSLDLTDINNSLRYFQTAPSCFEKLAKLGTWMAEELDFLQNPQLFPKLKCLIMGEFWFRRHEPSLEWLQWHLAPFADRLVQLHVDHHFPSSENGTLRFHASDSLQQFTWLRAKISFSKLRTLSIRVSMLLKERSAVKKMLRCLPMLETLNLIRFESLSNSYYQEDVRDVETARQLLNQEEDEWNEFPTLKRIVVKMGVDMNVVFTKYL
ncbi:hypothetical protein Ocin01_13063 [Orchesella cincta]|uniref:F-box domain-containing protein n=1 Tax=Orchesella cincta TaxID=48709 RepID=A0A1D2MKQ7_ORCCI|nr:hypothetical protein Ocin01_13063 [Orchesella cincta]